MYESITDMTLVILRYLNVVSHPFAVRLSYQLCSMTASFMRWWIAIGNAFILILRRNIKLLWKFIH